MSESRDYNRSRPTVNLKLPYKVDQWLQGAQRWWLTPHCVLCGGAGEQGRDLCAACRAELPRLRCSCRGCAQPLPVGGLCGRCQRRPRRFGRAEAAFLYQAPLDALIQRLKFGRRLALARLLGELMAEAWLSARPEFSADVIVPVPLHVSRLRERGFNQALELARPLAARSGVPLDWRCAERVRPTLPQSDLPAKLRRRNIKGAFRVQGAVVGRRVAVVDDVMTSGHTVNEFAATLLRAGAAEVSVWVGARVP